MTRQIQAILFDFDGVLADTMKDHFTAWNEALMQYGASIDPEKFYPLEGMPVLLMAREICKFAGINDVFAEELLRHKEYYYLTHHTFSFYPGVEQYVSWLHEKGIPIAIVSGGREERIRASAPEVFLNKFTTLITGESTVRGKPFPDAYLDGSRRLGVSADRCLVVENAPLGIQSAKSAGMYCVAITSTLPRTALAHADEIVDSFAAFAESPALLSLLN